MKKKTKKKLLRELKRNKLTAVAVATMAVLCVAVFVYAFSHPIERVATKRLVTFYDQGVKRSIVTRAATVQEALDGAKISVDSHDMVEPSAASKLTSSYEDVIIYRSRLVAIVDGKVHQTVQTVAQSPNAIVKEAKLKSLSPKDKATFSSGNLLHDGASVILTIERVKLKPHKVVFVSRADALTVSKGAQVFVDSAGIAHRETYYDLPMNSVIGLCGAGSKYTIRSDGAKVDQDGYVLIAANLNSYPRCTIVETSLGPGKVYDTGGFAVRYPYGFDLATDWTNYDGR